MAEVHRALPRAYAAVLELPAIGAMEGVSAEPDASPPEAHVDLSALADYLGERRFYRMVFDPYAELTESEVTGDLIDDLSDIFRDLATGSAHWERGALHVAAFEWRLGFQAHWGAHATSALRALFTLCGWHNLPWPERDE